MKAIVVTDEAAVIELLGRLGTGLGLAQTATQH